MKYFVKSVGFLLLCSLLGVGACGGGGSDNGTSGMLTWSVGGAWACATSTSCQDVYDIVFQANTLLTVSVTGVTGNSVVRLSLRAPGVPLGGTNLFNGSLNDRRCAGQNANDSVVNFLLPASGIYRLCVGRDWGFSAGASGTYTLGLSADKTFNLAPGQTVNDAASLAAGTQCP